MPDGRWCWKADLDWKPMSLSPRDMDFLEAKHAAAREIALAFGVPPMLLAIPGDNTYANYQEANRAFWRQSVLPLAARIACALTNWLAPAFGDGLVLAADTDRVEALSSDRAALWERVSNAPFLTVNEKRLATGYGAVDGGDVFGPPLELLSCGEAGEPLTPAGGARRGGGGRPFRLRALRHLQARNWGRRSMTDLVEIFIERGDLAHLALLLWAASASGLAWFALRELAAASRRFDDFVRELARFNERCEHERQSLRRRRRKEGAPVARSPFSVLPRLSFSRI